MIGKFIKDFIKGKIDANEICPSCYSDNLLDWFEKLISVDKDGERFSERDSFSEYSAKECLDCNWNNF